MSIVWVEFSEGIRECSAHRSSAPRLVVMNSEYWAFICAVFILDSSCTCTAILSISLSVSVACRVLLSLTESYCLLLSLTVSCCLLLSLAVSCCLSFPCIFYYYLLFCRGCLLSRISKLNFLEIELRSHLDPVCGLCSMRSSLFALKTQMRRIHVDSSHMTSQRPLFTPSSRCFLHLHLHP